MESGSRWNEVGYGLRHVFHSVNFRSAEAWLVVRIRRETKAADMQSQLDGVVQDKTI